MIMARICHLDITSILLLGDETNLVDNKQNWEIVKEVFIVMTYGD